MVNRSKNTNNSTSNRSSRNHGSGGRGRRNQQSTNLFLYGIHTVRAALHNDAREKIKLYASKNALQRLDLHEGKFLKNIEIKDVATAELDRMVGKDAVHQGAVLECAPLDVKTIDDLTPGDRVVVLDQISDPHNVGAIMRSCVAFEIGALITTSRNSAAQSAVLAKSASGAADMIEHIEVSNLSKALEKLNVQGYATIGLDSEGGDFLENTIPEGPIAIVLGAEGKGMREKTRATCTHLARLNIPGRIKSLNVSNAAALALYIAFKK